MTFVNSEDGMYCCCFMYMRYKIQSTWSARRFANSSNWAYVDDATGPALVTGDGDILSVFYQAEEYMRQPIHYLLKK